MAWIPAEDSEDPVSGLGGELEDENRLIQVLKMIRSRPEGRQLIREMKTRGEQMASPVQSTPESVGAEYQNRMGGLPDPSRMSMPKIPPQAPETPKSLGRELTQQNPFLNMMGKEPPMRDLMVNVPPLRNQEQADRPNAMRMRAQTAPEGYNPRIEGMIQDEAQGLMQDEAASSQAADAWHPPMMMPNTPRKPNTETQAPKPSGLSASQLGQDPYSKPLPSEDDMAKTAGALMLPPVERQPDMNPKDFMSMPFEPTPEPNMSEGEPDYGSYDPSQAEDPAMGVLGGGEGPDYRQKIEDYLNKQQNPQTATSGPMGLNRALQGVNRDNSQLGLMALFQDSANKMGTVGGKTASNEEMNRYTQQVQGDNTRSGQMMAKAAIDKKKQQDDYIKGMMFLAQQQQNDKKFQGDLKYRADVLKQTGELGRGRIASSERIADEMQKFREMELTGKLIQNQGQYALGKGRLDLEERELEFKQKNPGLAKGKVAPGLADLDKKTSTEFANYINKNGRARIVAGRDRLLRMAEQLEKDPNATGPLISQAPDWMRTVAGNKGPDYKQEIESVLGDSIKELAGAGAVSDFEAKSIMGRGFNPALEPKKNAQRLRDIASEMDSKIDSLDQTMQYFQDNNYTMTGYRPGIPQAKQVPPPPRPAASTKPVPAGKVRVFDPETNSNLIIDQADLEEALREGAKVVK